LRYALLCEYSHPNLRGLKGFSHVVQETDEGWLIQYSQQEDPGSCGVQMIVEYLLENMRLGYPDNALVANPSLGTGFVGAKTGDILTLWATGFGQTTPVQPSGVVTNNAPTVAQTVTVTVGGIAAEVIGAVLSPGFVGLYQVAIRLPSGVPTGDVLIKTSVAGLSTPDNVYLFIVQ
jgi:hypothetical protein